ncbi:unnamed protein product [Dovyalis caffra]|uniref:Fe2OG dioxygenase domain-containing protein n=1 Tax=Dovyalis caffra TaxID=77055 RepID=A0AAV1SUY8_9ROSI|nr:unnamed protein product [Dovyalis caffra]
MVAGKVVLCFTAVTKIPGTIVLSAAEVVKEAGGVGLIVAKNPSNDMYPCTDGFPCIEVDYDIGTRILFYIRSTRFPEVKLSPSKTVVGKPVLAKVAHFSSRGPNSKSPAILKPDIAAPGVNILAAASPLDTVQDGGYVMHSGSSMATPHVAGIVALLKAMHPELSPAAIKSALVTTAWRNHPSGFPIFAEGSPQKLANPFDFGGGIANPNGAADPGLVYDMGTADYISYLCYMDYNNTAISILTGHPTVCPYEEPSILDINLPSITIPNLRNSVTLTRTVTNVGSSNSIYRAVIEPPFGTSVSVNPDVLVFNHKTKKITFTVTVTTAHQVNTGYFFGSLTWTDRVHTFQVADVDKVASGVELSDGFIPLIDMDELQGCQVKNHKIPETNMNQIMGTTREFFKLPEQEKLKFHTTDSNKSIMLFIAFKDEIENVFISRESLRFSTFPFEDHVNEWPSNPPSLRKDVIEYCTSVKKVEFAVLEAISESLGLEKDYIDKMLCNHGQKLSINYYPICQEQDLEFTRGIRPHTDPAIVTLLLQDDVPGFKVLNNGKWVEVGHVPNTLVVHVGDLLQVISNCRYKSLHHQVFVNCEKERFSVASFCYPSSDTAIGPAMELIDDDHPAMYRNFMYREFYQEMWRSAVQHATDKRLDLFKTSIA